MNANRIIPTALPLILLTWLGGLHQSVAQGTSFSYQGRLDQNGSPANSTNDFVFLLMDAPHGGGQIGGSVVVSDLPITNGTFTVNLNFGPIAFDGSARWLEIWVRPGSNTGSYTVLSPRQPINAAPYAITASNLSGTLPVGQLSGTLPSNQLSGSYNMILNFTNPANTFSGNGSGLVNLNPAFILWGGCPPWSVCGNAGTTAGVNFLGTTDNQPLELKVKGQRAFRLEPTAGGDPNVIGGSAINYVTAGNGSTIGGGASNAIVYVLYGTVSGGSRNVISLEPAPENVGATISGGLENKIGAASGSYGGGSTVGGGFQNTVYGDSMNSTISGGAGNFIWGPLGTISGGTSNRLDGSYQSIAGGRGNMIESGQAAAIGGGSQNKTRFASWAVIAGGASNYVDGISSSVGGGIQNTNQGQYSAIGGGVQNRIDPILPHATIAGGHLNYVGSTNSTIGGGEGNSVEGNAHGSTIAGGLFNTMVQGVTTYGYGNTVGGGVTNQISGDGIGNTIGGGVINSVGQFVNHSAIGGGTDNRIGHDSSSSIIGGGRFNRVLGSFNATIGGGISNTVFGNGTTIAGGQGNNISVFGGAATIGGGEGNDNSGAGTVIAGGRANNISGAGANSTISGGVSNNVFASFGTIPGGNQAQAVNYGQMAYASGGFASTGDAQASTLVCRATTTNAAQTELFLDGSSARMMVPANSTWTFDILVTGRASNGNSAGYHIRGVIKNNAGSTTLIGAPNFLLLGEDVAAWDATAAADNVNDALVVRVTGAAATTIRWVATVHSSEVIY